MADWFTAWAGCGVHALRMAASVAISPSARWLYADAIARHSRMVSARQRLPALHLPTGDLMNPLLVDGGKTGRYRLTSGGRLLLAGRPTDWIRPSI
ncbi:hypothetical protein LJR022_009837 [Paraburkholderia hospita]|uniref:hypothetical protein n=1 Tax=Paraburkholderia hospita TaxID=169430 RepID=UPI003ED02392